MLKGDLPVIAEKLIGHYLSSRDEAEAERPLALAVFGQPGTGAFSTAVRLCGGYFGETASGGARHPAVVCEADFAHCHRLARRLLMKYRGDQAKIASKDAWRLEQECLKALVSARRDILWVTDGEKREPALNTLRMIKAGGYKTEAVFIAVPGRISAARAIFEFEYLKQKAGLAFFPGESRHSGSIHSLAQISASVVNGQLANRIRVLNAAGEELSFSEVPGPATLCEEKRKPRGAILHEQLREISPDEYRFCLELLSAAASGMDRRDAHVDERHAAAGFLNKIFRDNPEALYISRAKIAKNVVSGK
ncbi:MAG: zeta toxin family protein [Synergistaceae bacterium]|jgi:hypothetical protein|nr:zeta toxin family protein [Synergistaceae bacterium]